MKSTGILIAQFFSTDLSKSLMKNSFIVAYSCLFEPDLSTIPGSIPRAYIAAKPISPTKKIYSKVSRKEFARRIFSKISELVLQIPPIIAADLKV